MNNMIIVDLPHQGGGVVEFAAAGAIDVDHSVSICARVKMLTLMEELGPVKSVVTTPSSSSSSSSSSSGISFIFDIDGRTRTS